jgi:hypothetical protein
LKLLDGACDVRNPWQAALERLGNERFTLDEHRTNRARHPHALEGAMAPLVGVMP